jgi:hypothetical protein
VCCILIITSISLQAQTSGPVELNIDWKGNRPPGSVNINRTTVTLQVVENPFLRRGSAIHDNAWKSLRELGASDVRLAFWYPYPRMSVAELSPPTAHRTSWDFSFIDPVAEDFFSAQEGRPSVLNVATIPQWMFADAGAPSIPEDPDTPVWNYEQGAALRDPTSREVSEYYERVARWYIKGGFRDELGARHSSGHRYSPAYWEVFNEPEYEHNFTPAQYTALYDAITNRLHRVDRHLKFTGASLAVPDHSEEFFNYFLDHSRHAPHVRLDAISYHFYALEKKDESLGEKTASFFAQADHFLETVKKIEAIRKRLSPATKTQINETGCIAATDQFEGPEKMSGTGIVPAYWNLCGAMFSYVAGNLAEMGIDVVGASQLVGHPSQFPSVSLLDWTTGLPNPRYDSLKLLIDNLAPGDRFANSSVDDPRLYVLPLIARNGQRKIILVNKSSDDLEVNVAGNTAQNEVHVDATAPGLRKSGDLRSNHIILHAFAVMCVTMPPGTK